MVHRKFLGGNVLWLEPVAGGYVLSGATRVGPLFEGCDTVWRDGWCPGRVA